MVSAEGFSEMYIAHSVMLKFQTMGCEIVYPYSKDKRCGDLKARLLIDRKVRCDVNEHPFLGLEALLAFLHSLMTCDLRNSSLSLGLCECLLVDILYCM
jgi:hypothetical protein